MWTYTMGTAHNEFVAGSTYSDTATVSAADGTTQVITVNMTGTNDAPTLNVGTQSVQLVEAGGVSNAIAGTSAATITLTKADVDGTATYDSTALASTYGWATADGGATYTHAGTYGTATLNTSTGLVSYALDNTLSTTQALTANQNVADSFTVQITDGSLTTQGVVNFSVTGSNDAAVISGTDTFNLTETTVALTQSGTFTSTDVDGTANAFTAETLTGSYGSVVMAADGAWSYTASSAHGEFVSGTTYTDTFNIHAADGTAHALTINIAGASTPTAPSLSATQTLDGVTNLGVDSALVIAFDQAITLKSGHIYIYDDMGTSGWTHTNTKAGESIQDSYDNNVDITLANGVITSVSIGGVDYTSRFNLSTSVQAVGNNLVIDLKQLTPSTKGTGTFSTAFDWDFGANYHVNFDAGIVQNSAGTINSELSDSTTLNFTTVTPVDTTASAVSSSVMDSTGLSAALSSGYKWLNGNQSANNGALSLVNLDLTGGTYAVVVDTKGGTTKASNLSTYVNLQNFNATDILYNDNHGDMSMTTTDGLSAAYWGSSPLAAFSSFPAGTYRSTSSQYASAVNFEGWAYKISDSAFENQAALALAANPIIFG
ncbi:hypothetical protein B9Z41_16975 [Limnohabitans sp. JirII-31]|nr:hypothetical protein B9Z41_16975 [Limnohabitans sp. JirII-31]